MPVQLLVLARVDQVPPGITIFFGLTLIGLIVCLALEERLHAKKSLIAGIFAVFSLVMATIFGLLPFEKVVVGSSEALVPNHKIQLQIYTDPSHENLETVTVTDEEDDPEHTDNEFGSLHVGGERVSMPNYIPGIDWSVIAIILGSSVFVDVTSRSGLFTWIALKVTKLSKGDPKRLLYFYGIMTVLFSAVLNNVTAMIIVGSLTAVSLEKTQRNNLLFGFLLVEGLLTNIGGLLTLISSVPNIIIGTTANITFTKFFFIAAPYVALTTWLTLWWGARYFKIQQLTDPNEIKIAQQQVAAFDENDGVGSVKFFRFSAVMLAVFIILIAGASALPVVRNLGMGFVALSMAAIMLIRFRSEVSQFYRAIDWDLIGFFTALFIVIYVMEHAGVLAWIGTMIQSSMVQVTAEKAHFLDSALLLVGSAIFSSVTDNIPLSAMLASVLSQLGTPESSGLWWSVVFGSNLGGNLTPIGSASTLVAVTIMHKHKVPISFAGFVKYAITFASMQIGFAVLYVLTYVRLFA